MRRQSWLILTGILLVAAIQIGAWLGSVFGVAHLINWTRSGGLLVEVPLVQDEHSTSLDQAVRLIIPSGTYILYIALRPTDDLLARWDAEEAVSVTSRVLTTDGRRHADYEKTLVISREVIEHRIVSISWDELSFAPNPWAHVVDPPIVMWRVSKLWRAPENYFQADVEIEIQGKLPEIGNWTLRIERFVDAV